jgi:hypothetical protein
MNLGRWTDQWVRPYVGAAYFGLGGARLRCRRLTSRLGIVATAQASSDVSNYGGASRDRTDDLIVANDGIAQVNCRACYGLQAEYGPLRSNFHKQLLGLPGKSASHVFLAISFGRRLPANTLMFTESPPSRFQSRTLCLARPMKAQRFAKWCRCRLFKPPAERIRASVSRARPDLNT